MRRDINVHPFLDSSSEEADGYEVPLGFNDPSDNLEDLTLGTSALDGQLAGLCVLARVCGQGSDGPLDDLPAPAEPLFELVDLHALVVVQGLDKQIPGLSRHATSL